jgi:hypothetical protein
VNAVFVKSTYLNRFEPMDYGGSLDLAWRYLQGQRSYVDFIYNVGPIFPVTLAIFLKIFGFGKAAVLAHLLSLPLALLLVVGGCSGASALHEFLVPISYLVDLPAIPFLARVDPSVPGCRHFSLELCVSELHS